MSISAVSSSPAPQAAADTDRQIAVLKKAREVEKDAAEALVDLVNQATPNQVGGRINVLA